MIDLENIYTKQLIEIYKQCLKENELTYHEATYIRTCKDNNGRTRLTLRDALDGADLFFIEKSYHSPTCDLVLMGYDIKVKKSKHVLDLINAWGTADIKMPMQPIHKGRFVPNRIVEALLNTNELDLNEIACMDFTKNERMQFVQLIGYSMSGFGDLSYVDSMTADLAQTIAEGNVDDSKDIQIELLTMKLNNIKQQLRGVVSEAFDIDGDDFDEEW